MSVLAPLSPMTATEFVFIPRDGESSSYGTDGRLVSENRRKAESHWLRRAERLLKPEPEVLAYKHVPFEVIGTIRVRYKPAQVMTPRRFPATADDE